jgi:ribulose-5-phosphate 4-epimerase/fuculose-1-phosphate aldolase
MTDSNEVLADKLNTAWRFFFGRGMVDGFGHISARTQDPDKFLITPHELGQDSSPEDFVTVDLDGNQYGSNVKLPGELPIHTEVYRARPDVGSVAHFHCHHATSFSMSEHDLAPTYFLASIFRDGIPIHPDPRLVNDKERGEALIKTLGNHRAALMRAHGFVMTGADVEEMTAGVFIMEDNAKRTHIAASMGEYETLGEEEMAEIDADIMKNRGPIGRIWVLCRNEAEASKKK